MRENGKEREQERKGEREKEEERNRERLNRFQFAQTNTTAAIHAEFLFLASSGCSLIMPVSRIPPATIPFEIDFGKKNVTYL